MSEGFTPTKLEEDRKGDVFTIWLNKEDRIMLESAKKILEQPKDSTALKTLAWIGAKTLGDDKTAYILTQVMSNRRKNKRLGVIDFE